MFISIGQIVNTHGNKGEVKVIPLTDDPNRILELKQIYLVSESLEAKSDKPEDRRIANISKARFHKNMVLLTLDEVEDMNQAEAIKGYYIQLPLSQLKVLPEGRYYIFQLIGLKVYEGDKYYGILTEVLQPGSNDVYVVQDEKGKNEVLIPALKDVIKKVDLENRSMEVVLPLGLLD